ncbi:hypothetical protein [Oceanicola sp. 502str15]|uniref:hypothetical protein n=1 Tax=Oceanicola sp. 502str15 TaxID=2696061 RepID=UPI0020963163|nr:hypothetical protein [Oceanicola sp. 502str15]MCO6383604.1 hypothetical protein [Oceanicola sp. 502str15]
MFYWVLGSLCFCTMLYLLLRRRRPGGSGKSPDINRRRACHWEAAEGDLFRCSSCGATARSQSASGPEDCRRAASDDP